jgi:hypothetical protein
MIKAILSLVSLITFAFAGAANAQTNVSGSGTGIVTSGSISFDDAQHGGSVGADLTGHAMSVDFSFDFVDHVISAAHFIVSVEDVPVVGTYTISGFVDPFSEFSSFAFAGDPIGGSAQILYNAFFADSIYGWDGIFSRLGNGHYSLTGGSNAYQNQASPLGGDIFFGIGYSVSDAQIVFLGVPEAGGWAMLILGFGVAGAAFRWRRERRLRPMLG